MADNELALRISTKTDEFVKKIEDAKTKVRSLSMQMAEIDKQLKTESVDRVQKLSEKLDLAKRASAAAAKEAELYGDQIKQLTNKHDDLNQLTDKQKEKLLKLSEQMATAQQKANTYAAEVDKLQKEYEESADAATDAERATTNLSNTFDDADDSISKLSEGMEKSNDGIKRFIDRLKEISLSGIGTKVLKKIGDLFTYIGTQALNTAKSLASSAKKYVKESIDMAADYGDALGYSEQVFEDQAESVQKWVTNNSVALRINKSELQKHVNDMGSLYRSFGIGTKKAAELSEGLVKLATDLRAATGDNTSDIIQSLTSVMTGGYRAGYKYGIVINEAAIQTKALSMGLIEQGESLTQAQKELVIYELIMEQTAHIQGQGAKEAGNYKSQLDALKTTFDNLKISIGEKLLPVATDLITRANEFFESDAGKELLDSITKSVENISNKVQEMLKDGKLEEWMNNLKEKIPNIVDGVSDFTDKIIKLLPKIEDLTDKLLALFGIESESEKAKQALYDNRKAIEELAKSYDTSVDTIKTALVAFCEEEGYTLSEVVNNWDDYLPEIENYLNRIKNSYTEDFSSMWTTIASFAQENGKSVKEICQNWSTYEPQIIEYASKMGNDYSQKFTESLNTLQNFAQENNRELGDVLTDWQNNDIALVDEMNQFVSNTASMEDSVIQEISKLGPDSQSAIDSAVSSINTSSWDTFWRGVKQTASDVWSFIKTATSPSAWENSGFSLSGGARAAGGPVLPGRMYQVNDDHARRIEAFVPAVPGYILNGNDTQKVINNSTNNSRSFGDVNIYVSNYGGNIDQLADKLGQAVSQRRRIAGAW